MLDGTVFGRGRWLLKHRTILLIGLKFIWNGIERVVIGRASVWAMMDWCVVDSHCWYTVVVFIERHLRSCLIDLIIKSVCANNACGWRTLAWVLLVLQLLNSLQPRRQGVRWAIHFIIHVDSVLIVSHKILSGVLVDTHELIHMLQHRILVIIVGEIPIETPCWLLFFVVNVKNGHLICAVRTTVPSLTVWVVYNCTITLMEAICRGEMLRTWVVQLFRRLYIVKINLLKPYEWGKPPFLRHLNTWIQNSNIPFLWLRRWTDLFIV